MSGKPFTFSAGLALLFLLLGLKLSAQTYSFKKDSGMYVPLDTSHAISVNNGDVWDDDTSWVIPIGFPFDFPGRPATTKVRILLTNLEFLNQDHYLTGLSDVVALSKINPLDSEESASPISYLLDSTGPGKHHILKIQWENCGFDYDTADASYANFQVWLCEDSSNVEFHYGKCSVEKRFFQNASHGPKIGLGVINKDGSDSFQYLLTGKPYNPYPKTHKDSIPPFGMDTVPAEGIIYKFIHRFTGIATASQLHIEVWPVPVSDILHIRLQQNHDKNAGVRVYNLAGQQVLNAKASMSMELPVSGFPAGMYFVEIEGYKPVRFIKTK